MNSTRRDLAYSLRDFIVSRTLTSTSATDILCTHLAQLDDITHDQSRV